MKLTKDKALALYDLFDRLLKSGEIKNVRFHYLVVKNKKLVEPERTALQAVIAPREDFLVFEKKRMDICQTMAEKDDKGAPKKRLTRVGEEFVIDPLKAEDFSKEMNALIEGSKDVIEKRNQQKTEFDKLLLEEIDIEFNKIKLEIIPDALLGDDVELLFELVEE
jgi:hypothetical protein